MSWTSTHTSFYQNYRGTRWLLYHVTCSCSGGLSLLSGVSALFLTETSWVVLQKSESAGVFLFACVV